MMTSTPATAAQTTPDTLTERQIEDYHTNGFVRVSGILTPEETAYFRNAALRVSEANLGCEVTPIFQQLVNVWQQDQTMKELTLHPNIAAIAEKLAGGALRLWHDQILIKQPHNNAPTQFHQDKPYWPHSNSPHPVSCWIALVDVPVERGCMTFLPGTQNTTDLTAQDLHDAQSLFGLAPAMKWLERVTVPLRAGDCTFHHGLCAHMANSNDTDEPRVAHAIIFMDSNTTYNAQPHVVTDPLGLQAGQKIEHELFPAVSELASLLR